MQEIIGLSGENRWKSKEIHTRIRSSLRRANCFCLRRRNASWDPSFRYGNLSFASIDEETPYPMFSPAYSWVLAGWASFFCAFSFAASRIPRSGLEGFSNRSHDSFTCVGCLARTAVNKVDVSTVPVCIMLLMTDELKPAKTEVKG